MASRRSRAVQKSHPLGSGSGGTYRIKKRWRPRDDGERTGSCWKRSCKTKNLMLGASLSSGPPELSMAGASLPSGPLKLLMAGDNLSNGPLERLMAGASLSNGPLVPRVQTPRLIVHTSLPTLESSRRW